MSFEPSYIQKVACEDEVNAQVITCLMQKLLTEGIGHKEFKDTEIGKIPKEWQVVKIQDVAEINKESRNPSKETFHTW